MKKLLLSSLMALFAFATMNADTVVFNFAENTFGYSAKAGNGEDYTPEKPITVAPVTIAVDTKTASGNGGKFRMWFPTSGNPDFRCSEKGGKLGQTLTFTAGGAQITSIKFNATALALTANVGELSAYAEKVATWTGAAAEVVFTTNNACKINSIEVAFETGGVTKDACGLKYEQSEVVVRTDALNEFVAPTLTNPNNLTVAYETSNAEVATVDAATGAVTLTGTVGEAIVTAKFDGNDKFYEGTATYKIIVKAPIKSVKSVAEAKTLADKTDVVIDFALTVGFVSNKNIFACDAAGDFIQIYGTNKLTEGDVIPAGWEARYELYSGTTPELVPAATLPEATPGKFVAPVISVEQALDVETVNTVGVIKNVEFNEATPGTKTNFEGVVDGTTLSFRNNYTIDSVEAGKYDVTVVVTVFNSATSLYVVNYEKSTTTAIEEIAVEDEAAAVYYNMQGVRVDNPESGLFIRVAGNKVTKIAK